MLLRISIFVVLSSAIFVSAVSATPGGASSSTEGASAHEQGRAIYNFRCYYCHGYSGDAATLASSFIEPSPRDFTAHSSRSLGREAMVDAVTNGRSGTAMKSFSRMLSATEIERVVDFIRVEFMQHRRVNTTYHTEANGWGEHEKYRVAYPFATGELALDIPWAQLEPLQRQGKRLFLDSCISCHDRARVMDEGVPWKPAAVSYPRTHFKPGDSLLPPDAVSGASAFSMHDELPEDPTGLSREAVLGKKLFLDNCAFCHGADGSGQNWIGTFLVPPPRDLTADPVMKQMTPQRLLRVIREGLPGTSMPAWVNVLSTAEILSLVAYIDEAIHPLDSEDVKD